MKTLWTPSARADLADLWLCLGGIGVIWTVRISTAIFYTSRGPE